MHTIALLKDTFRGVTEIRLFKTTVYKRLRGLGLETKRPFYGMTKTHKRLNPQSATYNLQQTTIANFADFSKITNKA